MHISTPIFVSTSSENVSQLESHTLSTLDRVLLPSIEDLELFTKLHRVGCFEEMFMEERSGRFNSFWLFFLIFLHLIALLALFYI